MTTADARAMQGPGTVRIVARQVYYEQLNFWLNPIAAVFTVGFSVVFLVLLGSSAGRSTSTAIGGVRTIQYYVPGFVAYGVMATCFNALSTGMVVRRESGLLKRLRLSPLPTSALLAAICASAVIISAIQVIVLILIGRYGYHARMPHDPAALTLALVVGALSFTAIGLAVSTLVPNQEAAGPVTSVVFFVLLFLSGLWYPMDPHSALARISSWFPIRPMILATFAPFDPQPGVSAWAWSNLAVMAAWGAVAAYVAWRRWSWAPRHRGGRGAGRGAGRRAPAPGDQP